MNLPRLVNSLSVNLRGRLSTWFNGPTGDSSPTGGATVVADGEPAIKPRRATLTMDVSPRIHGSVRSAESAV